MHNTVLRCFSVLRVHIKIKVWAKITAGHEIGVDDFLECGFFFYYFLTEDINNWCVMPKSAQQNDIDPFYLHPEFSPGFFPTLSARHCKED